MKSKRGSTIVEAAMIFPVAILLVAGIIHVSLTMYAEVSEDSSAHIARVLSGENFEGADLCLILRGKQIVR